MKIKEFDELKKRIILHRNKCKGWLMGEPCFNCHYNTLTAIEKTIKNIK